MKPISVLRSSIAAIPNALYERDPEETNRGNQAAEPVNENETLELRD
jgi:hypothetical protein